MKFGAFPVSSIHLQGAAQPPSRPDGRGRHRGAYKLGAQLARGVHEHQHVHAHGHKAAAKLKVTLGQHRVRGQRARGLAAGDDGLHRAFDGGLDLGVAAVAHGGGQIGRADEHAVHTVHGADRFQVGQGRGGFGLHQQAPHPSCRS